METVEVVIRMPKSEYEELTRGGYTWWGKHGEYIKKGTVLPKGHGALKDIDKIVMENSVDMWTDNGYEPMIAVEAINNSPTVIEADKEEENVKTDNNSTGTT